MNNNMEIPVVKKSDLVGKNVHVLEMSSEILGDNGWFKVLILHPVDEPENVLKMFISANSALDRPRIVGQNASIMTAISKKSGAEYFTWRSPL